MGIRYIAVLALVLSFFLHPAVFAQHTELKKQQSTLEKLRKEIDYYEKKIREREKKEHATLDLLDSYDRQASLLRKLIARLRDDEKKLAQTIKNTRSRIGDLGDRISFLKEQYARYVTNAYKFGRIHDLELLLSASSLNQMLVRSEYLKKFSEQRQSDIDTIGDERLRLESQHKELQEQRSRQQQLIKDKATEEKRLARQARKRKALLAEIRKDKKNYKKEIDRRVEDAKKLEQLIAKLIERERAANAARLKEKNPAPLTGTAFDRRQGLLPWPVLHGKVISRFGKQQNPVLHTVTQNNGIDIQVPAGTSVGSVADGDVSTIWWLPSFGNLVIVNHRDGFRTVYAHLSEINVNEGDHLRQGEVIGKSGEALSGPQLHFEIWKDREKQDPEQWLQPGKLSGR
jgi:septal ring factor EnvC (AmiA/AmiB activator)